MDFLNKLKNDLKPEPIDLQILSKIQSELDKQKIDAKILLGGSLAQQTNIKGNHDVDAFVRFKEDKEISNKLEKVLKSLNLNYTRIKGSRDYFQIQEKITIELVPVIEITNYKEAKTIVDISPLHVEYFNKHATNEIRDEIRLVKQFCKANSLYGAESHIKGLSGHTINLLMLKYKTFQKFIEEVSKWKPKKIIDLEKHHKDPLMTLNKSKTIGPLIIIDPMQKNRNAAAALNDEKFSELIKIAKQYKKNPSIEFFKEKQMPKSDITIKLEMLEGKKDIVGSKILKIQNYLEEKLQKNDFKTQITTYFKEKDAYIKINTTPKQMPKQRKILGPPKQLEVHVKIFKEKYKNTKLENDKYVAIINTKYENPKDLIKDALKNKYVIEKAKKTIIEE